MLQALVGLGLLLQLMACDQPRNANEISAGGNGSSSIQSLRRGNGGEPESLDPALAQDVHSFNVLIDMYEGLVAEAANGDLIPGVAAHWTVSEDGLVYSFKIRPTARWSNGDPVSGADFVRSLQRVIAPETASAYAFLLKPIASIAAPAADTVEIRLSQPASHLLSVLSLPIAFPTHESGDIRISNGAFTLVDHRVGGELRLQKNPKYWDASAVALDAVTYFPIVDPNAEFNMYRSGELDITNTIPSALVQTAITDYGTETRIAPLLALYYLAFDLTEPPFDNSLLRQALTLAIDREQLTAVLGRGERAAYSVVPHGVDGYEGVAFDWQKLAKDQRERRAQELYARAGYSTENPLQIRYLYDADDVHEKIALMLSSMWRETLGVESTLEKREWNYFLATREQRSEWDVMRFAWSGDYNAADTFLNIFLSDNSQNLPGYRNVQYDSELASAAAQTDARSAATLMRDAEHRLINDYPVAPLYFYVSKHMVSPDVSGFEDSVVDRHPSRYLSISRDQ